MQIALSFWRRPPQLVAAALPLLAAAVAVHLLPALAIGQTPAGGQFVVESSGRQAIVPQRPQQPYFQLPQFRQPASPPGPEALCAPAERLAQSLKPLSDVSLDIQPPTDQVPPDCYQAHIATSLDAPYPIHGSRTNKWLWFGWKASGLKHQPAYFEDVPLERYGQGYWPMLQPLVSTGKFYAQAFLLPYQIGLDPPYRPLYTLGYERPGSHARPVREQLPWSWRAALLQAGAVVGGAALFP